MNYIKLAFWALVAIGALYAGERWRASVYKAGANSVQSLWDADKAAIAKTAADAVAAANKARDEAISANGVIHDQYETELLTARALNSGLSAKLQQYQARLAAGGGSLRAPGSGSGSSDTTPQPPSQSAVDAVLGAYDTACQADAAQLAALEAEIKPQL